MAVKHLVVGQNAAKNLQAATEQFPEDFAGDIIILQDTLGIGPIYIEEGSTHDQVRTQFWTNITGSDITITDEAQVKQLIQQLTEEDSVWFWMAPCISDVAAYFWLVPYFAAKPNVLHTISIAGLPFFNEKGTLFTPRNFSEVLPKEIVKCKRLALALSAADFEVDGEEWQRLCGENAQVRSLVGNKKIESKNESFYDQNLLNQCQFATDFLKASKVITQAQGKITDTVSDMFLAYRLRTLIKEGKLAANGNTEKAPKDWEVKLA